MIIKTAEGWSVPKYKITRVVITYDDNPELYPGCVSEEVILTKEQQVRLEEIKKYDIGIEQAEEYVLNGGNLPYTREELRRLIDLLPTENMTEDVIAMANRLVATRADAIYGDAKSV